MDRIFAAGAKNRALSGRKAHIVLRITAELLLRRTSKSGATAAENEINARQISTFTFHNSLFMK